MNTTAIKPTTYYCVFCESAVAAHICTTCNDYALTTDEAIANGYTAANAHITIAAPTDCFELTVFTEDECWAMSRDGIITYDEADHMVDGMTLFAARQILASYNCPCDVCGAW